MRDNTEIELDVEKIKADLAASARSARRKIAAGAQAYRDAMDKLAEQAKKLKGRG